MTTIADVRNAIDSSLDIEDIKNALLAAVTGVALTQLRTDAGLGTSVTWSPASFNVTTIQSVATILPNSARKAVKISNDTGVTIYIRLGAFNPSAVPGTYDLRVFDKNGIVLWGVDAIGEIRLVSDGVPTRGLGYSIGL